MKRRVSSSHRFTGPWWVAAALLRIEGPELVRPVFEELHTRLSNSTSVQRRAAVECGPVDRGTGLISMSVSWRDAAHPGVFPQVHGEIRLLESSGTTTEVEFSGEYEPPLGPVGRVADAMAGHRVVEQTVDDAVRRLAHVFETAVSEHIGTPWCTDRDAVEPAEQ
jgi:hypothetical protein